MPKEDYIEKHLNQMSRALGKVLFNAIGLPTQGQITQSAEMLEQQIEEALGLNIEKILNYSDQDFIAELLNQKKFDEDNFQKLGDVLFLLAQKHQDQNNLTKSIEVYKKCLALYTQVNKTSKVFSFERNQKT